MRLSHFTARAGVLAALGFVEQASLAQTSPPLTLEWTAPAGCPERDEVRRRTEALLGGSVESHLRYPLRASGTVTVAGGQFELRLETADNGVSGQRILHGASCEEVTSAAALIVALAVDPKAVAASHAAGAEGIAPQEGATAPATSAPPPPVIPSPSARPSTSDRGVRVTGGVEADLAADLGALPGFALGPSLSGVLGLDRVRLRLGATYFAPRFVGALAQGGKSIGGADVSLFVVQLSGCYVLTPGALRVGACADFEGGARFAAGSGFDSSNSATTPWLAAGGSLELTLPLSGPLSLGASAGAVAPFGRSQVRFRENTGDVTQIHELNRPSAVSGRAALGLGVTFW